MTRTEALGKLYKKITGEDMPIGANTTTEALQKVYEALTNDTTHHINVTKIIDDLATNWSEGGGGGGSSDFSTAVLSIVDEGGSKVNLGVALLNERGHSLGGYPEWHFTDDVSVILYKGTALLELENLDSANISVSGAIENVGGNRYAITGDCTITIAGGPAPA